MNFSSLRMLFPENLSWDWWKCSRNDPVNVSVFLGKKLSWDWWKFRWSCDDLEVRFWRKLGKKVGWKKSALPFLPFRTISSAELETEYNRSAWGALKRQQNPRTHNFSSERNVTIPDNVSFGIWVQICAFCIGRECLMEVQLEVESPPYF